MLRPLISLKARALRYLSMREHSRIELSRKLQRYAQESDDVTALLDWLEEARFLSQERFSESLIHRRSARFGNNRIVSELHSHGIQGEALGRVKAALQGDEVQRARSVLLKKFANSATDAADRAKRMRFLQQRGFSHAAIRAAMDHPDTGEMEADENAIHTAIERDGPDVGNSGGFADFTDTDWDGADH
jgi:regulatory protein